MAENYFGKMLLATETCIESYKGIVEKNPINDSDRIPEGLLEPILILWMYNFFHQSDGYGNFKPFLGKIFSDLFAEKNADL